MIGANGLTQKGHSALTWKLSRNRVQRSEYARVCLTKAKRVVTMARWFRLFGIFLMVAGRGAGSVCFAQEPAEAPAPAQAAEPPAAAGQAALDAELATEVQQLR